MALRSRSSDEPAAEPREFGKTDERARAHRAARAQVEVRVFREGDGEADADALYWDRIPIDERAEFVWQLSLELHELSHPTEPYEPGLSRSVARILGR